MSVSAWNSRAAVALVVSAPKLGLWNGVMRESFDGLTVLVVEDDWFVREDIVTGLRQNGWTVVEAATGAEALKLLLETKVVDLLITDILLADATTGWEVAEACRASRPETPVIYASGTQNDDGRRVTESVFLSKPILIPLLLTTCRSLLKGIW